jgi:hypothetical protein
VTCWPNTAQSSTTSTRRGRTAQPESQMTCSTMENTAPATMSHGNHPPSTIHRRRAATARRNNVADAIARMGVIVFSTSPGGRSVRVSTAKGQSSLPPTYQGGGVSPAWRGTIAVRLSCAPRGNRTSIKIHIKYHLLLSTVVLFQKLQHLLSRPGVDVHHQGKMTPFFHRDELCPWNIVGSKLGLLEGNQCVITRM